MQTITRPNNAKLVIDYYKKLLSDVKRCWKYSDVKADKIINYLSLNSGKFAKYVSSDLNGEKNNVYSIFENLIGDEYFYLNSVEGGHFCKVFFKEHYNDLEKQINDLSAASNGFKWTLSSRDRKIRAVQAYNYLLKNQSNDSYGRIQRYADNLDKLNNTDSSVIKKDFENNREKYRDLIKNIVLTTGKHDEGIFDLDNVINQNKKITDSIKSIKSETEKSAAEINTAVNSLLESETLNTLKELPVDELNKNRNGIRLSTLKNAGINTVADVYLSNEMKLSAINGISYDSACTIRRIAYSIASGIKDRTKIALNADDRTNASTRVVSSISKYLKVRDIYDNTDSIAQSYNSEVKSKIDFIKLHNIRFAWPFESQKDKDDTIKTYNALNDEVFGNYRNKVKDSLQQIRSININSEDAWRDFSENPIQFNNTLEEFFPGILGGEETLPELPDELIEQIQEEPIYQDYLLCTLRRYQEWGVKYILHQERALLGDEMGLGKTIEAIAVMASLKKLGATHFIVVCPASVLTNWCREIEKHSRLTPILVHGQDKEKSFALWLKKGGVAVTNYESANCFKFKKEFRFSQIVVDEAHYIKNPSALRTKWVLSICSHADRVLFMTGTPIENNVNEMIGMIKNLNPGIADSVNDLADMPYAPEFRQKIANVYYRRKREDVLNELPELVESKEWCNMNSEEESIYEELILNHAHYMTIRQLSWNVKDLKKSSKANRMLEIIEEAKSNGRKVLVFSFFLETIKKIKSLLGDGAMNPITGDISSARRQEIIDEFDKAAPGTALVCQIQSGGTGLNIQAASVVIICEPQLKPSIENQAISRAYRMGQARNVLVYRLLCENTIDERIDDLLSEKQDVFNAFADKSVAANVEKSEKEIDASKLKDLISEELERIKQKGFERN